MVRDEGLTACFAGFFLALLLRGFGPLAIREFTELSHFTLVPSRVQVPLVLMHTNRKRDVI